MNGTLLRALAALIPAGFLFSGAIVLFLKGRQLVTLLQAVGSGAMVVVVLSHVCEALGLFPSMGWGSQHSLGHYVDLTSAILALMLFPAGYLLYALRSHKHING